MTNFGVKLKELVVGLIPLKIRGDHFTEWIGALVKPIQTMNDAFAVVVADIRYELSFNGQVIYLEHILNDQFDPSSRNIYIDDPDQYIDDNYMYNKGEDQDSLTIYNKSEGGPDLYLYNLAETAENDDFIVFVPDTISFDAAMQVQMSDIIDRYRHAGKRYSFETYTP